MLDEIHAEATAVGPDAGPFAASIGEAAPLGLATFATLIANSSIQFFDLRVDAAAAASVSARYFEVRDAAVEGDGASLHLVELDENGVFRHPVTDAVADPALSYAVSGSKALEAYCDVWLPVPFMRAGTARDGALELAEGPSNWARILIHREERGAAGAGYRAVLALDTTIETSGDERAAATAPTFEDARAGALFCFSCDVNEIGWFVSEPWVDEWLVETFREARAKSLPETARTDVAPAASLEHLSHYLTLLAVLARTAALPDVRLLAHSGERGGDTLPVDLVVDLGASRSLALLAELASGGEGTHRIEILPLRDLARPWIVQQGIFSSRIEFSRAHFGKEVYSRWSGRTSAFAWPSIARVGAEALRLAADQHAADAFTGLSSPMRYLWDERPSRHVWRYAGAAGGGQKRNALVSGPLLAHLTESGDVVEAGEGRPSTTKPRFSRSALATFFAAEIIQHALCAINSPAYRGGHPRDVARHLDRVVLVAPTALQPAELAILRRRIEAAVTLVWQAMGWPKAGGGGAWRAPEVVIAGDGALATQLAFLDNEIAHKFRGKARQYLDLMGRVRSNHGTGRSLRIATLDVGGATSSLAVATYALADSTAALRTPHLVEGFAIGGDDVLKALVETFVLPAIEQRLVACKLVEARQFLRDIVNGATHGRASRLGEFRRRLASEIAMPAAIAILKEHEILRAASDDRPTVRTLGDLLAGGAIDPRSAADELEQLATDEGSDGFQCLDTVITFTLAEVAGIIRRVLGPAIASAVMAIRALDCDVLLLSGWLSRLPVVKEALLEGMPTRPDRIIAMHEYRMGPWFPGRSALGNVDDPKHLPAVGAILASRPQVCIGGLALALRAVATGNDRLLIGRIGANGLIADDAVLFDSRREIGGGRPISPTQQATITVDPPVILGIRRAPIESWPALPMYVLAFEEHPAEERPKSPIRVTLEWGSGIAGDSGGTRMPWIVRATDADGIELAASEIGLRLQTLGVPGGHWLDTGVLSIA